MCEFVQCDTNNVHFGEQLEQIHVSFERINLRVEMIRVDENAIKSGESAK